MLDVRFFLILAGVCWMVTGGAFAQSPSPQGSRLAGPIQVYFSPRGGCTTAIINALQAAKTGVTIQAYSFTHKHIAMEIVQAKKAFQ